LLTWQLAGKTDNRQPAYTFKNDTVFRSGGVTVQTFYPGAGHTTDNIVIWLPKAHVLFGGCFIKSLEAQTLGNVKDASVSQWPGSVNNVQTHFKNIKYLIPGHQSWKGDTAMLKHTIDLAKKGV